MVAVYVLLNQKGGVGKSTLTMNLAAVAANAQTGGDPDAESTVAAVSIDPQGSAVWWADRVDELPFHIVQAHDDLAGLSRLGSLSGITHTYVDTPGFLDLTGRGGDPLGTGDTGKALRTVIDRADLVIVPIVPEPLAFDPTARTIDRVIEPAGKRFLVVINQWDPRDGRADLEETREFIDKRGWPLARTVIRQYKVHARASAEGLVVTEYPANRTSFQAREDFTNLALEIELLGGGR